ncbi:MAG: cytochrome bd-I oxidase subunit CydX [Gammaproteobacteria bacterium]
MWYFTWILGLLLACSLGIINVLRLEAQEVLDKEHVSLDPLTGLLDGNAFLQRLREKIENSRRNGMPFSLLHLNLSGFRKQHSEISDAEMDRILTKVVTCFKHHIREVDIASRYGNETFMIALPGAYAKNAATIAAQITQDIAATVQTASATPLVTEYSVTEYPQHIKEIVDTKADLTEQAQALLDAVDKN